MERKQTKKKQVFEPSKNYSWEPDDVFQLTGLEIDKINKALAAAASSPDFQKNIVIYEGLLAFNNFFKTAVEEGSIKALETEEKPLDTVVVGEQAEEASVEK